MKDAPYSRVYHSVIDDPKFTDVFQDDRKFATWVRLLMVADSTHPAPAPIPRSCNAGALSALVRAGIVDLLPGYYFRIHGLAAERGKRSAAASAAASVRWSDRIPPPDAPAMRPHSNGNAPASDPEMHQQSGPHASQDETRRDKPSRAIAHEDPVPMELLRLVEERTGRPWTFGPGSRSFETLQLDVRDFGAQAVEAALMAAPPRLHDASVLVWDAHKRLNPMTVAPSPKDAERERQVEADRKRIERETEATRRRNAELYGEGVA